MSMLLITTSIDEEARRCDRAESEPFVQALDVIRAEVLHPSAAHVARECEFFYIGAETDTEGDIDYHAAFDIAIANAQGRDEG